VIAAFGITTGVIVDSAEPVGPEKHLSGIHRSLPTDVRHERDHEAPTTRRTAMAVQPIPEGYPRVTPYLNIAGAADAIDFYCKVLGATERMRMGGPDGGIGHAELDLGGSVIMLADESTEVGNKSPGTLGGTPVSLMVYVEDVDATYRAAIAAGATEIQAVEDKFYGDRSGMFKDPWGHEWTVATHVEDVSEEDMERRMAEMQQG
jgi:PhnB protein